ncbi:MAG TPA: 50S ribosomal protein L2 [Candidatus Bathyarchaeota archaeon]|nr:50S ribosomal protein L2 [Candidatus Bathyarchaeota archaeon]
MGKRIRVQRRGRGGSTFRARTHRRVAPSKYPPLRDGMEGSLKGIVKELTHDPGRGCPLALIELETGEDFYMVAPEGLHVGQIIEYGESANIGIGSILPLGRIPEGTIICNVELRPGDGGKLAKSSGAYAMVISHTPDGSIVRLPSGKTKVLDDRCRATIGVVSGAGRTEKPFLKAGRKYHLMRSRGRKYPRTRGVAMIAAVHPFGGGRHQHPGKPTTVSRHAPPGRKVGLIAARASGSKKKKVVRRR